MKTQWDNPQRSKEKWNTPAKIADCLYRLGEILPSIASWKQYNYLFDMLGPGCEVSEKCANLLVVEPTLIDTLKELKGYLVREYAE